jgi:surface polysaccharide O-acyltransferase-like enzyme
VHWVQTLKRSFGLDLLRILMATMVVGLHTHWLSQASPLCNQLTVDGLFRMAVPVFFLINGYYAFDAIDTGRARSWLKRILQIYLFWAIVYLPAYFPHSAPGGSGIRDFVGSLAFGYWHLWYMVALALAGWVLWRLRSRSSTELLCLAVGLYAVGLVVEFARLRGVDHIPVKLYRNFLLDALPFLLIGYVLRRDAIAGTRPKLWILSILGLAGILFESFIEGRLAAPSTEADLFISLLVLCPAIFLLVRSLPFTTANDRWAKASSAIYFTHVAFLLLGERMGIASGLPLFAFVLALSALSSWPLIALSRRLRFIL